MHNNQPNKYSCSNTGEVQTYQEQDNALIVTALLCKVGTFTDASGTITTILYDNLQQAPSTQQNYTNYYFENKTVDYVNFSVLAPYANNTDDTNIDDISINALLQIYNAMVQDNINQINNYGLNIQANNLITALKNSYVNLMQLCKSLSVSNKTQYISYKLPYTYVNS